METRNKCLCSILWAMHNVRFEGCIWCTADNVDAFKTIVVWHIKKGVNYLVALEQALAGLYWLQIRALESVKSPSGTIRVSITVNGHQKSDKWITIHVSPDNDK